MKLRVIVLTALFLLIGLISHAQEGSPGYALLKDKGAEDQGVSILWSTYNPDVFDAQQLKAVNELKLEEGF